MDVKNFAKVILSGVILAAAAGMICGCNGAKTAKADTAGVQAADQSLEQTTCPVTGGPVNRDIYTIYKGKKVYFCCEGCKKTFEKNPEKYVGNLPQFAK